MKNLFLITEEEKKRILDMHIIATKKQYLKEISMIDAPDEEPTETVSNYDEGTFVTDKDAIGRDFQIPQNSAIRRVNFPVNYKWTSVGADSRAEAGQLLTDWFKINFKNDKPESLKYQKQYNEGVIQFTTPNGLNWHAYIYTNISLLDECYEKGYFRPESFVFQGYWCEELKEYYSEKLYTDIITGKYEKHKFDKCKDGKFPIKFGCKTKEMLKIQGCIGLEKKYQTGNFGTVTQKRIKERFSMDNDYEISKELYNKIIANCGDINKAVTILKEPPIEDKPKPAEPIDLDSGIDKNNIKSDEDSDLFSTQHGPSYNPYND